MSDVIYCGFSGKGPEKAAGVDMNLQFRFLLPIVDKAELCGVTLRRLPCRVCPLEAAAAWQRRDEDV